MHALRKIKRPDNPTLASPHWHQPQDVTTLLNRADVLIRHAQRPQPLTCRVNARVAAVGLEQLLLGILEARRINPEQNLALFDGLTGRPHVQVFHPAFGTHTWTCSRADSL